MRSAKCEDEFGPGGNEPLVPLREPERLKEPLLISMEDLAKVLRAGKTTCFKLVGTGEIESVLIGRKRMPVYESVKAYVARLRERAKIELEAA